MNTIRVSHVVIASIASLGLAVASACSSSSSNGSPGDGDSGGGGSSSGGSSSGGSSGGGTACTGGQVTCIGVLGNSCVDPGGTCLGTTVVTNECATAADCASGQVCCSGYVTADGGDLVVSDAGGSNATGLAVAVKCLAQCPTGGASSQVCSIDDAGAVTGPACPDGTSCRNFLPAFLAPKGLPNALCLPPLPDGGFPRFDGGIRDRDGSTGTDAGSTDEAAAPAQDGSSG